MKTRAFSYIRFSSAEQRKGKSEQRQRDLTARFCEAHDLELDNHLFFDSGVSGFRGKNYTIGALSEFLRMVKRGQIPAGSFMVCEKLDRISRDDVDEVLPVVSGILKAGIKIATTDPERIYDKSNLKGFAILELIMHFILANEESQKKSTRARDNWRQRRNNLDNEKLTAQCPAWLKLNKATQTFEETPACETLRTIFDLAAKGHGRKAILNYLTTNRIKPFGKKQHWSDSYLCKLMTDRRLIGEYQPFVSNEEGQRVPLAKKIRNYYPVVIREEVFFLVQQGVAQRRRHRGRTGANISNLFTGLLYDARDNSTLVLSPERSLVSSAALRHDPGTIYLGFPYQLIEQNVILFLHELLPHLNTNGHTDDINRQIAAVQGKIAKQEHLIEDLKSEIKSTGSVATFTSMIVEAETEIKSLTRNLNELSAELSTHTNGDHETTLALLDAVRQDNSLEFRSQLKSKLPRVLDKSLVLVTKKGGKKVCTIQLHLKDGTFRHIILTRRHKQAMTRVDFCDELELQHSVYFQQHKTLDGFDFNPNLHLLPDLRFYPYTSAEKTKKWAGSDRDGELATQRQQKGNKSRRIADQPNH